jgi:sporulation protein YlmC with PRC-barrel domain
MAPADDQTAASGEAVIEEQPEQQASAETGIAPEAEEATDERPADQAAVDIEAPPTDQAASTEAPAASEDVVAAGSETAPAEVSTTGGFLTFSADQIRASDLIGQSVYSGEDSIGEVSDIIMNDDGETRAALIDVGGFLGVGEKSVALPFEDIQISENAEDGVTMVTVAMSREQLEQLPAVELPQDTAAAEQAPAMDTTTTMPAQPADQTAEAPAAGEIVTGSVNSEVTYELARQDISAENLIGTTVYGSDDSSIGEISDVVFDRSGTIQAVVVDVGGFLGMGEKPVAVGFDSLNVRTDENGTLVAMVNQTQDQLDQAPAYEEPAPVVEQPAPAGDVTNGGATAPAQ